MKIITADDFGMTKGINKAIYECLKIGSIQRASIMVNQKYTLEAIELSLKNNFAVGLHFNITQGFSISDSKLLSLSTIDNLSIEWIENELKYQIKFLEDRGIKINHIDVHHNLNFNRPDLHFLLLKYNNKVRSRENNTGKFSKNPTEENLIKDLFSPEEEITVHPAYFDSELASLSKQNTSREIELNILKENNDIISTFTKRGQHD